MNKVTTYLSMHHSVGIIGGAALGAAIGYYGVKKGMTWTLALTAIEAGLGYYLGHQSANAPVVSAPAMASAPSAPADQSMSIQA